LIGGLSGGVAGGYAAWSFVGSQVATYYIETHGDQNGISLRSRESLGWLQLKESLTEINIASGLNLIVVVAACHGDNIGKILRLSDRCPIWRGIGPQMKVSAGELLNDFQNFYKELLHSLDLGLTIEKLNTAVAGLERGYSLWRAEDIFR
jgi:hypothetical protein